MMPTWTNLSFQDTSSPIMEHLVFFHDHAMIVLSLITMMTLYSMLSLLKGKKFNKFIAEGQEIESIWTILPGTMLIFIALPSMKTLYLMEDSSQPSITIKTTGHQWFWSYEYTSLNTSETENFMENSNSLRLMKTSSPLTLPSNTVIRFMITSSDVIHSWAIPALAVKTDALPGRLNQALILSKRVGLLTGQCSEICGMNHSFMPILTLFQTPKKFIETMKTQ